MICDLCQQNRGVIDVRSRWQDSVGIFCKDCYDGRQDECDTILKEKMSDPKILDVDTELYGCSYERVDTTAFLDHDGKPACVMPRRFRCIADMRNFVQEQSRMAKVYVYDLKEYNFKHGGLWYWLRCAIRAN